MPYLTYEEFQFWGTATVLEEDFQILLSKASDVLDNVTRSFYRFNDINMDVPFRRERFKKAVVAQIDYFSDMGATSGHQLAAINTITLGRTQISGGAQGTQTPSTNRVASEVYMLLYDTGLLYRGVSTL